jgi:hypothetical protein
MEEKPSPVVPIFSLSLRRLALATVILPLGAFCFCVTFSYQNYFKTTTHTHCNVWNFAPSISSAISVAKPQKYVWKFCIALHSAPRFFFAFLYKNYFKAGLRGRQRKLVLATFASNILEICGLLALSFATSREDYTSHKIGFILFIACSSFYLCSSYTIVRHLWWAVRSKNEEKSLVVKKIIVVMYLVTLAMALYFFYRHNKFCEPGVYSIFSICEYLIVLLNMSYHCTAFYDFHDKYISV